jgi:colicin import membrane protein
MGKNSLIKSTSKKKKTSSKKKPVDTLSTAKKKAPTKAAAKKVAEPKKNITIKDLLFKKFDAWKPEKRFTSDIDEQYLKNFSAPPFFSGNDKEAQRIATLLSIQFDLKAMRQKAAEEESAKKAEAQRKASEEKAAAEKAEAERKAAEARAAAEKVEAEKKAAEKAEAARKAAAQEAAARKIDAAKSAAAEKKNNSGEFDHVKKTMIGISVVVGCILLILVMASVANMQNYYVTSSKQGLEIWRGSFAPIGKNRFIVLPGMPELTSVKKVYSKKDVFPLIATHYIGKADELLVAEETPNFTEIKLYLKTALMYAVDDATRKAAQDRLNNINLFVLLYKAETAAQTSTITELETALAYYNEALLTGLSKNQTDDVQQKIASVSERLDLIKADVEKKAAEDKALDPVVEVIEDQTEK